MATDKQTRYLFAKISDLAKETRSIRNQLKQVTSVVRELQNSSSKFKFRLRGMMLVGIDEDVYKEAGVIYIKSSCTLYSSSRDNIENFLFQYVLDDDVSLEYAKAVVNSIEENK